jgi:hypothetical protein
MDIGLATVSVGILVAQSYFGYEAGKAMIVGSICVGYSIYLFSKTSHFTKSYN